MRGRAKRELSALRSSSTAFGGYSKGNDGERIPSILSYVKLDGLDRPVRIKSNLRMKDFKQ
jgi:hypothetical protein